MANSTKTTYKPAKKGNYKSVVRMAEGGNVSELDYSERREYIEENYAPFITDAQMIFSIYDSGIEYDYKGDRKQVTQSIIEQYKSLADYTESTLPQETIYEIQDWDLVRKEIDPDTDEVIGETPLEQISSDNTYNFSYNGLVDLNWRVYHDEEYDRFFYVIMPHLGGDIRGNYGDAIILEGNDKEELFYRFYEGFVSGGVSVYFKFKDGSEIGFDSEQDSDVFNFRLNEVFEPTGMAQKYLNDFEKFDSWKGDEFLEETIDIYLARNGVVPMMMAGGSLNDETPMAYIQILGYDEGKYFNLTDYADGQDVINGIYEWMNGLNEQFGGNREEYEVTDYEGFGDDLYDAYMGENEFEEIIEAYEKYQSSDFPADVISAYKNDSGSRNDSLSDVIDEMDNNYFGKYENLKDFGYEMVQQGVYEPSENDVYITDTDKRIIAGEEADSKVDEMRFEDFMDVALDTQSEYEVEKSELEDKISEIQSEIDDLTDLQSSVDDDDEYETIAEQIEEKEVELDDVQNELDNIDSRFEDEAREEARELFYDEIYDRLENDLEGWLSDYGYDTGNLADVSFLSVDYEKIGDELSSDYLIVEFDGDMYFFNNYAKGGRITASKIKPKFDYYIVENSTKKLVSGYSTKQEAIEQRKLLVQQYPSMRFEIFTLGKLKAKTDLDVYAKKDYVELSTLDKIKKVSVDAYRYGKDKVGQAQAFLERNDVKGKIKRGARKVADKTKQGASWLQRQWREADFGDGKGKAKYFADGGGVESLKVGSKVGFLRPRTGRYEYAEVLSIDGDNVNLVVRHPKRSQWDNYFTETKERITKFLNTPSEDWKDGRPVFKVKYADGGEAGGFKINSISELYDWEESSNYPYARDMVAYFIFGDKEDNLIHNAIRGAYSRERADGSQLSEIMLGYEYNWMENMEQLDIDTVEALGDLTDYYAKGGGVDEVKYFYIKGRNEYAPQKLKDTYAEFYTENDLIEYLNKWKGNKDVSFNSITKVYNNGESKDVTDFYLKNPYSKGEYADGGGVDLSKYKKGVVLVKSAKASNDNDVWDILNEKWKKYNIVNSRAFDLETPYNRGWIDEGISINVYLLKDTETNKYYWDSDYLEAKKNKFADGGEALGDLTDYYAKGGGVDEVKYFYIKGRNEYAPQKLKDTYAEFYTENDLIEYLNKWKCNKDVSFNSITKVYNNGESKDVTDFYLKNPYSKGEYADGGEIGFVPIDVEEKLVLLSKWGGIDVKGVIGLLNAMIDTQLTDNDLLPNPTKNTRFQREKAIENKVQQIWKDIQPNYKGNLKGNQYYSTIKELVSRNWVYENLLQRFKPFRKYQTDKFANGGGVGEPYDSMTKYQLEKELDKLTNEFFDIRKSYNTTEHPRQIEIEIEKDKIITLLYGKNFSGVGQKYKYDRGGATYQGGRKLEKFIDFKQDSPRELQSVEWSFNGHSPAFIGKMYFQKGTGFMFIEKESGELYKPKSSNKLFWRELIKYAKGGGVDEYDIEILKKKYSEMNVSLNTKTGQVYVGGIKPENKLYSDDKGYYLIDGYGKFMNKKYPIKKYFNHLENTVLSYYMNDKFEKGGESNALFEIVVVAKGLEKDGGQIIKDRFSINSISVNEAKNIAKKMWEEEMGNSDFQIIDILTDTEYRNKYLSKKFSKGGESKGEYDVYDNKRMLLNQANEIEHHSEELNEQVSQTKKVPAWVIAKMERATTDLSDITHYLDGENKMAHGGNVGEVKYEILPLKNKFIIAKVTYKQQDDYTYPSKEFIYGFNDKFLEFNDMKSAQKFIDNIEPKYPYGIPKANAGMYLMASQFLNKQQQQPQVVYYIPQPQSQEVENTGIIQNIPEMQSGGYIGYDNELTNDFCITNLIELANELQSVRYYVTNRFKESDFESKTYIGRLTIVFKEPASVNVINSLTKFLERAEDCHHIFEQSVNVSGSEPNGLSINLLSDKFSDIEFGKGGKVYDFAPKKINVSKTKKITTQIGDFNLGLISKDFVYFVNMEESDENGNTLMYGKNGELLSDNYFASNELYETLERESTFDFIHPMMEIQRQEILKGN